MKEKYNLTEDGEYQPILPSSVFVYGDDRLVDRFVKKFQIDENTKCWIWIGAKWQTGYGMISIDGERKLAHRVSFFMANGYLSDRKQIDHLCKNPSCVNPKHLDLVTARRNQIRGNSPMGLNAMKTHCKNGHEFTPENTYARNPNGHGGRECRTCWTLRQNSDKVREYKRLWAQKSRSQMKLQLPPS